MIFNDFVSSIKQMACTHYCSHNQQYFDEKRAQGLIRGGALPAILGALGGTVLSFAAKTAITSLLTNALRFFMGLLNTKDLPPDQRKKLLRQYTKHLMSRQSLLTGDERLLY